MRQQPPAMSTFDRWFDSRWGRYAFGVEAATVLEAAGVLLDAARILDAGCGTGRFTTRLQASGASVVGLDLDPTMLEIAAARTPGRLVRGDAHQLPFRDGAFDRVVAVTLCEFTENPARVIAELARVTRVGGRVVVGSLNPASPWGLRWRRRLRRPPWVGAHFLSRSTLLGLARPFGRISISAALYAPGPFPGLRILGPALERLGRLLPAFGAFHVLTLERNER